MKILVIEDDAKIAGNIVGYLSNAGHCVDAADTGPTGLIQCASTQYDLLIVDRMLPGLDGISLIKSIRQQGIHTPVLMVTALTDVNQRVEGLEVGADDYLCKPFAFAELLARVEALYRRYKTNTIDEPFLQVHDLTLNLVTHEVERAGEKIQLKPREYRLLEYLVKNVNQVVTRSMLLEKVWDYYFDPQTNIIDVHISRLRHKIDKNHKVKLILTIRGAGYAIKAPR
ncbi:response regulator transcription factor [Zooshikella ganghwensis]|uniref:DNA-binding response regulator n=1 Tax=Zooshikella ganghwensis TaxID=202772 RepID=A0A4P9VRY7_9GAMM|nr:response regulator transcription factor [Zooshikella ganghwensis]RDH45184.1 DNA-binding response regulator [Zooshikella ganghwensis]